MSDEKTEFVTQAIEEIIASGRELSATAVDADDMAEVMRHPKAVDAIYEMMTQEAGSAQQGEDAPDFALKPLQGFDSAAPVKLSDHFGKRPVALIFGSYT